MQGGEKPNAKKELAMKIKAFSSMRFYFNGEDDCDVDTLMRIFQVILS